jgi:hypothetical protein
MPQSKSTEEAKVKTFLEGLRLSEISLKSCQANVNDSDLPFDPKITVRLLHASNLIESGENSAVVDTIFLVKLLENEEDYPEPEDDPELMNELAVLAVEYRARYETNARMTDAIFEAIKGGTLRLHTVPFARQWIHETTTAMGLEPILLPLELSHPAAANTEPTPRQELERDERKKKEVEEWFKDDDD